MRRAAAVLAAGVLLASLSTGPVAARGHGRTMHYVVHDDETIRNPCTDEHVRIRGRLFFTERDVTVHTSHGVRHRFHRSIRSPHLTATGEHGRAYHAWISLRQTTDESLRHSGTTTDTWITVTTLRAPGPTPDMTLRQHYHLTRKDGRTRVEHWTKTVRCTG